MSSGPEVNEAPGQAAVPPENVAEPPQCPEPTAAAPCENGNQFQEHPDPEDCDADAEEQAEEQAEEEEAEEEETPIDRDELDKRILGFDMQIKECYKEEQYTKRLILLIDLAEEEKELERHLYKLMREKDRFVDLSDEEREEQRVERAKLAYSVRRLADSRAALGIEKQKQDILIMRMAMKMLKRLIKETPEQFRVVEDSKGLKAKRLEILKEIKAALQEGMYNNYSLHPMRYKSPNFFFVLGNEDPEVNNTGRRAVAIRHGDPPHQSKMMVCVGKISENDGRVVFEEEDGISASDEEDFVYRGAFNGRGERHGEGMCIYADGAMYEGSWVKSRRQGKGNLYFTSGDWFQGDFIRDQREGFGVLYLDNGDRYEGEFHGGIRDGHGEYYFSNGDEYEGEWKEDMKEGHGVCKYRSQGLFYEGEWHADGRWGEGTISNEEGGFYRGGWREDAKHGISYVHFPDGMRFDGKWKKGARRGPIPTTAFSVDTENNAIEAS